MGVADLLLGGDRVPIRTADRDTAISWIAGCDDHALLSSLCAKLEAMIAKDTNAYAEPSPSEFPQGHPLSGDLASVPKPDTV